MIPNIFSGCCHSQSYDESHVEFNVIQNKNNPVTGLFKNITKPFKESQVSSYTEKLSIAKKLKQKKVQNSLQNNTNRLLFNQFEKSDEKNSNNNESTKIQQEEQSVFSNFFHHFEESEKSLYEELMSPRTLIESQILNKKEFK